MATLAFEPASARLTTDAEAVLAAVAWLGRHEGGRVRIVGHAGDEARAMRPAPTLAAAAARRDARALESGRRLDRLARERAAAAGALLRRLGLPPGTVAVAAGRPAAEPYDRLHGEGGDPRAEVYLEAVAGGGPRRTDGAAAEAEAPYGEGDEDPPAAGPGATDPAPPAPLHALPSSALAAGTAIATLHFAHGRATLGRGERAIVAAVAAWQQRTGLPLAVVGHASAAGRIGRDPDRLRAANQAIAAARAATVAAALAGHGVAADRLATAGRGSDAPALSEATPAGEAHNRRVEIYVDLPAGLRLADSMQDQRR